MEKDSVFTGIILGVLCPVVGYIIVEQIFNLFTQFGLMEVVTSSGTTRRFRTLLLLAICCNLLPFRWARVNYYDQTLRGIIFPTLIYVGYWVYKFKDVLF